MLENIKLILIIVGSLVCLSFADTPVEDGGASGLSTYEKEAFEAETAKEAAGTMTKGLAGIGAGLAVIGAGIGIGRIFGSAAEATARQPEAANEIRSTVNLPLFLLEGVGIIALVVCLLAVVL